MNMGDQKRRERCVLALAWVIGTGALGCAPESNARMLSLQVASTVDRVITLGEPTSFVVEDKSLSEGLRKVERGSVLMALPADWDRSGPLELRLAWTVRDDFPIGEAASPRIWARGALIGAGDYLHTQWIHPDEQDLDQEVILEVSRPDYGLEQGEILGHPYRGATSTLAIATIIVEPSLLEPQDEFLALQVEAEWERWPIPGAIDGELLSVARARYAAR